MTFTLKESVATMTKHPNTMYIGKQSWRSLMIMAMAMVMIMIMSDYNDDDDNEIVVTVGGRKGKGRRTETPKYVYVKTSRIKKLEERHKLIEWLKLCWKLTTSYSMLVALVFDMMLIMDVYQHHDKQFFGLALGFMLSPLAFLSALVCLCSKKFGNAPSRCDHIPILNVPRFLISDQSSAKHLFAMLLSGFMTYPLYIINLSFMLERTRNYQQISIYNKLQFLVSLFVLCVSPCSIFVEITCVDSYLYQRGLVVSFRDRLRIAALWITLLSPIMCVEVIHFFPSLFAYYMDNTLTKTQLIIVFCVFNIPKLGFIGHMSKKALNIKDDLCIIVFFFLLLTFSLLPLIPYVIVMLLKDDLNITQIHSSSRKSIFAVGLCNGTTAYYYFIVFYLFVSYIFSSFLVWYYSKWQVSSFLFVAIVAVCACSLCIISCLPKGYYWGRMCALLEMPKKRELDHV
ncbi:hypothetical protein RFI_13400 [Reticulomyxa filosa]|uniref:Uncharacterized protein n=1 Tax=Reticulomyxa filosa TaxID=46433 RepID=X6NDC5_RETFI|nr:hypothetical protein RFI_13400 [Reticulomyxa filosa]|eukprot:ETO23774.1 hypothetical protein RFI_13400 [Reticulomyxa filosa]